MARGRGKKKEQSPPTRETGKRLGGQVLIVLENVREICEILHRLRSRT